MDESIENKLQHYLTVLFANIPKSRKASELKQELLSNMLERYNDYISEGKNEDEAYKLTIESIGNTDELLSSITPDENLQNKINSYKQMKARNIAIGVGLYFIAVASLIGIAGLSEVLGKNEELGGIIGFLTMFVLCAIATGLIIYTNICIPQEVEPYVKDVGNKDFDKSTKKGRYYSAILELFWLIVTVIYLGLSFLTHAWHITWLIWLIGAALAQVIKLVYSGQKEEDTYNE